MKTLIIIAALALAGCQGMGMGGPGSSWTPESIAAAGKANPGADVQCWRVVGPGYTAEVTIIGFDRGTVRDGGMSVSDGCKSIEITSAAPPKVQPVPPAK